MAISLDERRPSRAEARRVAFLEAARQVFFTHGYSAANIQDVVRLARGSMATLYSQFGNKEGLFEALIENHVHHLREPLEKLDVAGKPIRLGLHTIGEVYLHAVLQPGALALYKIMVAESRTFPHVMQRIMPNRRHIHDFTARYLEERIGAGDIRNIPTAETATFFIDMLRGQHQMDAISDPNYVIDSQAIRAFVTRAVDLICDGLAPR
jgi:AcrR family transcriptional regulator